jgi:DNA-nicking Smr family endonuclease
VKKKGSDDAELFRAHMQDVRRAPPHNRVEHAPAHPQPLPLQRLEDERAVLAELSNLARGRGTSRQADKREADDTAGDEFEIADDTAFLRTSLPRDILRKLRRTHWAIQDDLDLHGMTGDEAVEATAGFLADCRRRGLRCVRIIHGKGRGSRGREPVLKGRVRRQLMRRSEVLAFVEPRAVHGGAGAVVVLLAA